jgi:uncharacterized protein
MEKRMDSGAEIVDAFYAAQRRFYATGDAGDSGDAVAGMRLLLAGDVEWHIPGRNAIAGTYRGPDEVLRYFSKRRKLADSTFRVTSRGMLAGADQVVHFADGEAVIDGRLRTWGTVGIFRISDGRIAECRLLPFDQYEFDEIWAGAD